MRYQMPASSMYRMADFVVVMAVAVRVVVTVAE